VVSTELAPLLGGDPSLHDALVEADERLRERIETLEKRLREGEDRRRAMLHIMVDLAERNRRLSDQRKAMLHILIDYEQDRRQLTEQAARLDGSRRALMHILQDLHGSKERLEGSRKAMIHIMGDLRRTTEEVQEREQELREKQAQLVQTAKLATIGELTTGVAHELNNPLNNIGLFIGNVIDQLELGQLEPDQIKDQLSKAMQQVGKATEIINHLRTFGRAAPVAKERLSINEAIERSVSLMSEQLRLRQIDVRLDLAPSDPGVLAHAIQMEQAFINLLTNARDALANARRREIAIQSRVAGEQVEVTISDTGPGIPEGMEERIFDPFFTTKEVGQGTGLGLSILYGILSEHGGTVAVENAPNGGAVFTVALPLATHETERGTG
jgi:C4-dicarboxylate-specific signal transduction histidine kinase